MSNEAKDGGLAFARPETELSTGSGGLSKRDYFAAAALTGLLANNADLRWQDSAQDAYKYADAMLSQRKL